MSVSKVSTLMIGALGSKDKKVMPIALLIYPGSKTIWMKLKLCTLWVY